jgi:hypothetical protein
VHINKTNIQQADKATYLRITLDSKLTWRPHILKKRKQMDLKAAELEWINGKKSYLSLPNKLLIYKTVIKPIWTYGIQLWGSACKPTVDIIQRAQSKLLRSITAAPWYVSNRTLHTDPEIPYVKEIIRQHGIAYVNKLKNHENPLLRPLLLPPINRRLKRKLPQDLRN